MARKFGKVGSTLDRSEKWWALPDDQCRLTFDWLLWCRHGGPTGLFSLPPMYLAVGLRCDQAEATRRLDAIERAGLIQRAPGDVLRIVQWFAQQNAPRNPSAALSIVRQLRDRSEIGDSLARSCAVLEFAYCALAQVGGWNTETTKYAEFEAGLRGLLEDDVRRVPDLVDAALNNLGLRTSDMVWGIMWDMVSTSCGHGVGQKERERETEREREIETRDGRLESENETRDGRRESETGDGRLERERRAAAGGGSAPAGRGQGPKSIAEIAATLDAQDGAAPAR